MSFEFTTVDDELGAILTAAFEPQGWKVQDALSPLPVNPLAPVLTYLQTDVDVDWPGSGRMADDYYAVSFQIELAVPEKDPLKASKRLMTLLPKVYAILRELPDVDYSTAAKGVSPSGVAFYTLPITALTHYSEE